jgi:hypothetical protein
MIPATLNFLASAAFYLGAAWLVRWHWSGPIAYLILRSKRNELTLPLAKEGTSYTVTNLSEQPLVLRGTRTQPLTGWSDVELKKGDTYTFEVKGKHWVVKP